MSKFSILYRKLLNFIGILKHLGFKIFLMWVVNPNRLNKIFIPSVFALKFTLNFFPEKEEEKNNIIWKIFIDCSGM